MSRTTTGEYRCDHCKASLTRKETTPTHITLEVGSRSGLAADDGPLPGWRIVRGLPAGQYHFCMPEEGDGDSCIAEFFRKALRAT